MKHLRVSIRLLCVCLVCLLLTGCGLSAAKPAAAESAPSFTPPVSVELDGQTYPVDTRELTLSTRAAYRALLREAVWLPALETVELKGECGVPSCVRRLLSLFPGLTVKAELSVLSAPVSADAASLDLSALEAGDVAETAEVLALLPALRHVVLPDTLSFSDYACLKRSAPQADFEYRFVFGGQELNTHTESVEFIHVELGNEGARELDGMLPYLDRLQSLYFDRCGIDDAVMARLRDHFPEKDIAWMVYSIPHGGMRSDVIRVWLIGGYDDEQLRPLKYLTKVKYLDLGHNGIYKLGFLYHMPELEVLILENDYVKDITAIGSCKNLEYLEVGETNVTDISPLAKCTNLAHLNIGRLYELTDISPLFGLTKLERVYGKCSMKVPEEQIEHLRELLPNCEIRFEYTDEGPIFGSWRYQDGKMVPRYALLHDQIGYDW